MIIATVYWSIRSPAIDVCVLTVHDYMYMSEFVLWLQFHVSLTLNLEGDQFKVDVGEKKLISNIDIEMYLTLLDNI